MRLGDTVVMASDAPPDSYSTPQGFSITIRVGSSAEVERIFRELSEGGTIAMPMDKTFFAERFGMATDRFRIPWTVLCEQEA